jgi:heat shock protein HtpX
VARQAKIAGIAMPEVAIYDAPEVNAFATGMSKNSALVAVSTGLLDNMTEDEAEAVLAHEVSHVANGDMVTLALIQGVVNTFVIFLARIIGNLADQFFRSENDESTSPGIAYYVVSIAAELILGIFASMVVMWFSRKREFHADAGAARLTGPDKMIAALQRLQAIQDEANQLPDQLVAFGIASGDSRNWKEKLFSSHPSLDDRIAALENGQF